MKYFLCGILSLLFVGCASAQRTPLIEEDYASIAAHVVALNQCQKRNLIDYQIAGYGTNVLQNIKRNIVGAKNYSEDTLKSYIIRFSTEFENGPGSNLEQAKAICNQLAAQLYSNRIDEQKREVTRQQNAKAWEDFGKSMKEFGDSMQRSSPKITNCYQTSLGVSCTTY